MRLDWIRNLARFDFKTGKSQTTLILFVFVMQVQLYTVVQKNCHPYSSHYSFYKCGPVSVIFGTRWVNLQYNNYWFIHHSTSPMYCCRTTLGKLTCCLWLSSPCASDDRAPAAWNSEIHSSGLMASLPVAMILVQLIKLIEYGLWCGIVCRLQPVVTCHVVRLWWRVHYRRWQTNVMFVARHTRQRGCV